MKRIAWLCMSLTVLACERPHYEFDKSLIHPNGLTINRPVGFEEFLTDNGFRLEESKYRHGKRPGASFDLKLTDTMTKTGFKRKRMGDVEVQYHIESGQGNGPPEYTLWAAKPSGQQWIMLLYRAQGIIGRLSELQNPEDLDPTKDFALAWTVLEQARLESP